MISTKPSGYCIPDRLPEWSVKFWATPMSCFRSNESEKVLMTIMLMASVAVVQESERLAVAALTPNSAERIGIKGWTQ